MPLWLVGSSTCVVYEIDIRTQRVHIHYTIMELVGPLLGSLTLWTLVVKNKQAKEPPGNTPRKEQTSVHGVPF